MKNFYLFSLLLLAHTVCIGQATQPRLRSQVFILSTCEPTTVSIRQKRSTNDNFKDLVNRLEVSNKTTNAFQINGINPLRYRYYINNEAITQFMEGSALSLPINTFINGGIFSGAPEIRIPVIFKTDSISGKVKTKIANYQKSLKILSDSINTVNSAGNRKWSAVMQEANKNSAARDSTAIRKSLDEATDKYYSDASVVKLLALEGELSSRRNSLFREYQTMISGLPINNPQFPILAQYRLIDISADPTSPEIDSIKAIQRKFANDYRDHHNRFKEIEKGLAEMEKFPPLYREPTAEFLELLSYYNFTWYYNDNLYYGGGRLVNGHNDNVYTIRQQILDKRFQLYEEFVINVATKIGVHVQNMFREYSNFNNTLEHFSCVNDSLITVIQGNKKRLGWSFDFIQQTSAELQIMVKYLDINTDLYENVAKNINNNYLFLLGYLKNLEFVTAQNSYQYTLPTHDNLKNIDLIRYKVEREDNVTKNKQTYNYDFWIKGGLKVDFSVALVATRLTDNVYNKVLLGTKGDIDSIRITRQDDGRADFAFGGMVNLVRRNGARWVNVGGSVGVAYSTNQRLQILASGSLHYGKTERLIIHFGAAFGRINYLDVSANNFRFYNKDLTPIAREKLDNVRDADRVYMLVSPDVKFSSFTVPTFEKFVIRPFIGVSYNLSKRNALQAVSGAGLNTYNNNLNVTQEK